MKSLIFFLGLFFYATAAFSQEEEIEDWKFNRYRVAIASLNSYVPAIEANNRFIIPAWGLEFEYQIAEKWAIGANLELEVFTYAVKTPNKGIIERDYPFLTSLLVFYEINEHIILASGYGREFERNEDFDMLVFSAMYAIILPNNWDIVPTLTFNKRIESYDTFSLGFSFGKSF